MIICQGNVLMMKHICFQEFKWGALMFKSISKTIYFKGEKWLHELLRLSYLTCLWVRKLRWSLFIKILSWTAGQSYFTYLAILV